MTEHVDIAAPPSVIGPPGTAIEIRGLSKQFASNGSVVSALEGVDLAIEQGEFLCVVGLSGCGKTTLLNILGCLGQASAGGVEFPPQALGKPLRSIVFQEHGVYPWLRRMGLSSFD